MFDFFKSMFSGGDQEGLKQAISQGAFLVDVRTPEEFSGGSAKGAVNIPLGNLPNQLSKFKGKNTIVVFCRSGNRSSQVASYLQEQGFKIILAY